MGARRCPGRSASSSPGCSPARAAATSPTAEFRDKVVAGDVTKVTVDNNNGDISGTLKDGTDFNTTGPLDGGIPADDVKLLRDSGVEVSYETPQPSFLSAILPYIIMIGLFVGFFLWMQRRAQGQMSGVMNIGRSKAKTYDTERPGTTFDDVAGYEGVKQEITEVVDFLRHPEKFAEIGARIPKGVLLVGPPGTGKTLIARAVAGEAGVPFLSVTGSDFMEMFVGVGASRVRDLFQNAKKLGKAIIFVDEIDSIGRKRGAGLGGGHDEREQTLNQMLSEMDGFEATEGIVMMAATNRPDILDPALLGPGRFDRQVVVPLPELEERLAILRVHGKNKHLAADVDLRTVARGTPGMSGADLANLVNEAALYAVRGGDDAHPHAPLRDGPRPGPDGPAPRVDGPLRLRRRRSSPTTRPATPCAPRCSTTPTRCTRSPSSPPAWRSASPSSCPPRSATSTARTTSRTASWSAWAAASPRRPSTACTPPAPTTTWSAPPSWPRKMVREWGMSPKIGPQAWGSQGQVFLGDSLMNSPRVLRRHRPGHRRRGRAHPPRAGAALPRRCSTSTATASTSWPGRCSSARPSTAPRSTRLIDLGRQHAADDDPPQRPRTVAPAD